MPAAIHYDVDGLDECEHRLLALGERAVETRPLLEIFARQLEGEMATRFAEEGEGEWPPLAPSTIARKGSSVIGRETDAMMEALTTRDGEGALREFIGDEELIFGINLTNDEGFPYPVVFDKGTTDGTQAPRPLFHITTWMLRAFTKNLHAYLMALDRAEFGINHGGDNIAGSDRMPAFPVLG